MENKVEITLNEEVKGYFDSIKDGIKQVEEKNNKTIEKLEEKINMLTISEKGYSEDPARGYKNHVDFFKDVIDSGKHGDNPEKMNAKLRPLFNTVGSDEARVGSNPAGGFLVPPVFMPGLKNTDPMALQEDTGNFTTKIPMASDTIYLNAKVDKNHTSSVSGGLVVYRREETADLTASQMTFEQIELKANSLGGLSYASEEILARSPISFAALIAAGLQDEVVSKLNYERIWGTGVGQYLGIANSPARITIAKEGGQTADTINGTNILKMRSRAFKYARCMWHANHDTLPQLMNAYITGSKGDIFLFAPGNGVDKPDTLMGRPIIFDENCATLGDAGDIILVDFAEYLEGQLGGSTFAESTHVRFVQHERAFKFVVYNAGAPWWRSAMTPKLSTTTLSPIVFLAAR